MDPVEHLYNLSLRQVTQPEVAIKLQLLLICLARDIQFQVAGFPENSQSPGNINCKGYDDVADLLFSKLTVC